MPLKVRKTDQTSTKDYILNSKVLQWKVMYKTVNLMVIFWLLVEPNVGKHILHRN